MSFSPVVLVRLTLEHVPPVRRRELIVTTGELTTAVYVARRRTTALLRRPFLSLRIEQDYARRHNFLTRRGVRWHSCCAFWVVWHGL